MTTASKENCLYLQSGGPTAVINSSFQGIWESFRRHEVSGKLYIARYGIEGLIQGSLARVDDINLPDLSFTPGAMCGSSRKKLPLDSKDAIAVAIVNNLKKFNIRHLFINGGNDSMDGALRIFEYLSKENYPCTVIGIPKTVDNDLFVTDHTPGYGSAAKYIALATSAVEFDDLTYQKGRINIIEAMGRDCGYLAASSLLSIPYAGATGPDYIYVPEVPFDVASFLAKAKKTYEKKGRCLIVVSEGIRDYQGRLISSFKKADDFGNIQMGGVSSYLSSLVAKEGYSTRAIELSVLQRSAYFAVSETDVKEARGVSDAALKLALKGQTGVMVTIERKKTKAYGVTYSSCPLSKVAGKAAKMPSKYLAPSGDFIRPSFLSYALPLLG